MKKRTARVIRMSAVAAVLLAGLAYSALTLATPAYASSCDCNEGYSDAREICAPYGFTVYNFFCPVGVNRDHFEFQCSPQGGVFFIPCSY